jgi:hypothetical protein
MTSTLEKYDMYIYVLGGWGSCSKNPLEGTGWYQFEGRKITFLWVVRI